MPKTDRRRRRKFIVAVIDYRLGRRCQGKVISSHRKFFAAKGELGEYWKNGFGIFRHGKLISSWKGQ